MLFRSGEEVVLRFPVKIAETAGLVSEMKEVSEVPTKERGSNGWP